MKKVLVLVTILIMSFSSVAIAEDEPMQIFNAGMTSYIKETHTIDLENNPLSRVLIMGALVFDMGIENVVTVHITEMVNCEYYVLIDPTGELCYYWFIYPEEAIVVSSSNDLTFAMRFPRTKELMESMIAKNGYYSYSISPGEIIDALTYIRELTDSIFAE